MSVAHRTNWDYLEGAPEIRTSRPEVDLIALQSAFNDIKQDPYCAGGYRWRAASRFSCEDNIKLLPRVPLYQSPLYNTLPGYGGVSRDYPDLSSAFFATDDLFCLIEDWLGLIPHPVHTISVHQVRTNAPGEPVPEGRHRDGNDWVGIFVVDRHHLQATSGCTRVWDRAEQLLFDRVLEAGELVNFDDRLTLHDTSEILSLPGKKGWRDVLIFSTPDHSHYLPESERNLIAAVDARSGE